jgi:hypothetical protein
MDREVLQWTGKSYIETTQSTENVRLFLEFFIQNFRLQPYDRKAHMATIGVRAPKMTRAKYYEVVLHEFLGVLLDYQGMRSYTALEEYAIEILYV